jgi:large subunit ribosomal protein L19
MSKSTDNNKTEDQVLDTQTNEEVVDTAEETTVSEEVVSEETYTEEPILVKSPDEFRVGDTIKIYYRITEGNKSRIQPYEGIVISKRGEGASKTFIVRRIGADSVGVERIFPQSSPNIEKIEILKRGKVRRAKLYYLREKKGRAAMRIKELGK